MPAPYISRRVDAWAPKHTNQGDAELRVLKTVMVGALCQKQGVYVKIYILNIKSIIPLLISSESQLNLTHTPTQPHTKESFQNK